MRRSTMTAGAVAIALTAGLTPDTATGQELERRVRSAPDGWIRFTYEARDGVCGNGKWISFDDGVSRRGDSASGCACEEGPVRIEMRVRDGRVRDLETEVGGEWAARSDVTDLGEVPPAEAVDLLFDVAETARVDIAEDAIFPATLARDVETWPRLLEIARGEAHSEVREQAVFWLGQEASERATEGLTSIIEDEDELEVREHAVFALSQRSEPSAFDALMRLARTSPEPQLRRRAIFWLGQRRGDDPRVLELLEEILTRGG